METAPGGNKEWSKNTVFTIGHSNYPIEKFIQMLKTYEIKQLVDIRSFPTSKYNPQFNAAALKDSLAENKIDYIHLKDLGGRRPAKKDSVNSGWRSKGFQGYADYMQGDSFKTALAQLIKISKDGRTAIMCAESVPWRCHRQLVADALTVHGINVVDILSKTSAKTHKLTDFAKVKGTEVTYPLPLFA